MDIFRLRHTMVRHAEWLGTFPRRFAGKRRRTRLPCFTSRSGRTSLCHLCWRSSSFARMRSALFRPGRSLLAQPIPHGRDLPFGLKALFVLSAIVLSIHMIFPRNRRSLRIPGSHRQKAVSANGASAEAETDCRPSIWRKRIIGRNRQTAHNTHTDMGRRRLQYKVAPASQARLPCLRRPCHASRQRPINCEDNNCQGNHCRNHSRRRNPSVHWRSPSIVKGGARQRLSAANVQESLLAMQ